MVGIEGTPLSYIIRENDAPDIVSTFSNFIQECIAREPLKGVSYEADAQTVHQSTVSCTTWYPSKDWVKPQNKYKDSRKSMKALKDHFSGERNTTRRVAEADLMKEMLYYKSERQLTFENFLTKLQKM